MEHHDWLTTPTYGNSGEQGPRRGAISVIIYRIDGTHIREMKDDAAPGGPLPPRFPPSLSCNTGLPLGL
jgi:hypothetical protein